VFIRQVLQHLCNDEIGRIIAQLQNKYKYLVLTEHLPSSSSFQPNIDKLTGPHTRLSLGSGVMVTSFPFDLKIDESIMLCEVEDNGGVIRTFLYKLKHDL
jgi:hypothetical protein